MSAAVYERANSHRRGVWDRSEYELSDCDEDETACDACFGPAKREREQRPERDRDSVHSEQKARQKRRPSLREDEQRQADRQTRVRDPRPE